MFSTHLRPLIAPALLSVLTLAASVAPAQVEADQPPGDQAVPPPASEQSEQPADGPEASEPASDDRGANENAPATSEGTPAARTGEQTARPRPTITQAIEPGGWLVAPRVGAYRRGPLHVDAIEVAIATGRWQAPRAGDKIAAADGGEAVWREENGRRSVDLAGGYAYAEFDSPADGVMLLEAPGVAAVCLNGEWLPGDPYGLGTLRPPTEVREGKNWLLAHLANPAASPRLVPVDTPVALLAEQATLPTLVAPDADESPRPPQPAGQPPAIVLSVPVANASTAALGGCQVRVSLGGSDPVVTPLRRIEPLLVTPITVTAPVPTQPLTAGEELGLSIELVSSAGETIASASLEVAVTGRSAPQTHTFVSDIDGSVQPYRVLPPGDGEADAVVLVLHDAGDDHVEALEAYQAHPEAWLVAPYGRGRWAFDWEDWSRLDAIEALEDFVGRRQETGAAIDANRVSVAGSGMGGHGALRLATLRPDLFASVGMVDPWISFTTQGRSATAADAAPAVVATLDRERKSSDPLRVIENLAGLGVSLVFTGESGVGVYESRLLRERLGEFHRDFAYRERAADAAAASDLPPDWRSAQLDWLVARRRPDYDALDTIEFATPDVGASSSLGWVTVLSARPQGEAASVRIERDLARREVTGVTENAGRLRLSLEAFGRSGPVTLRLDGGPPMKLQPGREGMAYALAKDSEGTWRRVPDVSRARSRFARLFKEPSRTGGFKSVFRERPILAYGTLGEDDASRWAAAKARYDAHQFLYRGAGRLEVTPDTLLMESLRGPGADADRSVVLYGNAETNAAWPVLRQEAFVRRSQAVRVAAGEAWLGERPESGDALAVLAVRPRVGSRTASVGVIGGSGPTGMRLTTRLRYFWSGVEYPDYLLFGPGALEPFGPSSDRDVRAAGYFDADWGVDGGQVVWRDLAI
ncbi:alpha/beta hydrolase-fold protein [Botrimarina sp.]|uniref:alpha/beta hydrolase-fold protein n=1 Tax=Botrimarina sp. TaxID=2795802 RepID=UPI0032EF6537